MARRSRAKSQPKRQLPAKKQHPAEVKPELVEELEWADLPPPVIEAVRSGDIKQVVKVMMTSSSYKGPLPPASEMIKYKEADPSAPARILASFEKQGDHRREMEGLDVRDFIKLRGRSQIFAFIVLLVAIGAATFCAFIGQPLLGASIIIPTVLGVGALGLISMFYGPK